MTQTQMSSAHAWHGQSPDSLRTVTGAERPDLAMVTQVGPSLYQAASG